MMVVEMALSSFWTLSRSEADFLRAALKTAWEYLRAMVLAARRPMPAGAAAVRRDVRNIVENDGGDEGGDEDDVDDGERVLHEADSAAGNCLAGNFGVFCLNINFDQPSAGPAHVTNA